MKILTFMTLDLGGVLWDTFSNGKAQKTIMTQAPNPHHVETQFKAKL